MQTVQTLIVKCTKPGFLGHCRRRAAGLSLAGAFVTAALLGGPAGAAPLRTTVDPFELKADQQTSLGLYLTAPEAYRHVTRTPKILFIDARSRAEVNFLGMPDAADAHIPFGLMHPGYQLGEDGKSYNRVKNRHFVAAVKELIGRKGLGRDPVIFVICRDSHGVARVANKLAESGFTRVYTIIDGFEGDLDKSGRRAVNGWKNAGLPWSYGIGTQRAYRAPMEAIEEKLSN